MADMRRNDTSTANTFLESALTEDGVFEIVIDIKDYPDIGSSPEMIETTTLSDEISRTQIPGLQDATEFVFTANYSLESIEYLEEISGESRYFRLVFGKNGENGMFQWKGELSVMVLGKGVSEVRELQVTISSETTPVRVTE